MAEDEDEDDADFVEDEEELLSKVEVTTSPVLMVLGPMATGCMIRTVCPLSEDEVNVTVLDTVLLSSLSDCCFAVDVEGLCVAVGTLPPMAHSNALFITSSGMLLPSAEQYI